MNLKSLAEECGVAQGTVSNILAARGAYSPETRERVIAAAKRIGYVPSRLASSLRDKRSTAVGVLMSNLTDPYFAELLDAISRALAEKDLEVMVSLSALKAGADVLGSYRAMLSWRLRAFLITADDLRDVPPPPDLVQVLQSTPLITLNADPWPQCPAVFPDRSVFAEQAVGHLVALGHRRIGCLGYTADRKHFKAMAIQRELDRRGLELREQDFWHVTVAGRGRPGEDPTNVAFELGKRLAHTPDRPTAIIAWTDSIASRFVAGFMAAGGRVPKDLSVVAYNNTRSAAFAALPLTVVGVPMDRFARATVSLTLEMVAARLNDEPFEPKRVKLLPDLVVRESTVEAP